MISWGILGRMPDNAVETIELLVTPGHAHDGSLYLRVSPDYADEVRHLLDEEQLGHGEVWEFSHGPELVVVAVQALSAAGGVAALSRVLAVFLKRHDNKSVKLADGTSLKGYRPDDVARILKEVQVKQAERDATWSRILADRESEDPSASA